MIKKPIRKDGLFAFQVRHLRTNEELLHTVYFPLTKALPHTIKMFYFVYGKKKSVLPEQPSSPTHRDLALSSLLWDTEETAIQEKVIAEIKDSVLILILFSANTSKSG